MFNPIFKFKPTALLFASLLPLLSCSDYVEQYENEWKEPYGSEESFNEILNKFDWPWATACDTSSWLWCSYQKGNYSSQTDAGERWEHFVSGSATLSFSGKDNNAYNFTTDILPDDLTPILRRNGGIAVKLEKASGNFEAGIQVKSEDIAKYSNIVIGYGNEYSEAYISLRYVDKAGKVKTEWRHKLNEGVFAIQSIPFEDFEYVTGEKDLVEFITNEANTIAFVITHKASVKQGINIVAVGFTGDPLESEPEQPIKSSSSTKSSTVKSSSSTKSTTAKSSSSTKSNTTKSSSSKKTTTEKSSSSSEIKKFIWNGSDQSDLVKTGYGTGAPWTTLLDTLTNGTSSILYPEDGAYNTCNGLCGLIKFGSGNAWAEKFFTLDKNENSKFDISSMEGLCIAYTSDNEFSLLLNSNGKEVYNTSAPRVILPKVTGKDKYYIKDFKWSDFDKASSTSETGEDAASALSSIAVLFTKSTEHTQFFNIYQIGSYGECGGEYEILPVDIDASYFYNTTFKSSWDFLNPDITYGEITDSRDNRVYKTVKIENQTWLAENMNLETENSFCYNDSTENCEKHGRLYTWAAAMDSAALYTNTGKGCDYGVLCKPYAYAVGICPEGWRLPNADDFKTLTQETGYRSAKNFMSIYGGWKSTEDTYVDATDDVGFSALPAGIRYFSGDYSESKDYFAALWHTNESSDDAAYATTMSSSEFLLNTAVDRNTAMSVRCIKIEPIPTDIADEDLIWYGGKALETQDISDARVNDYFLDFPYMHSSYEGRLEFANKMTSGTFNISLLNACSGGICGKTTNSPDYSRITFSIDSTKTKLEDWGGICVTYSTDLEDLKLWISTAWYPLYTGDASVTLPMSREPTTQCFTWMEFERLRKLDLLLPYVSNIDFVFPTDAKDAKFNILAIGTYKAAKAEYDKFMQDKDNRTTVLDYKNHNIEYGEFTDSRDDKVYKTVRIGSQTWMAQNLNYESEKSACYGDKDFNCDIYGRLYSWDEAQTICPEGWHLPEKKYYYNLINLAGETNASKKLKTEIGWADDEEGNTLNGEDYFGFSVLPAGFRTQSGMENGIYRFAQFQTSEEDDLNGPCYAHFENIGTIYCSQGNDMRSVRCIKETKPTEFMNSNITYDEFIDTRDNQIYKTVKIGEQTWMAQNLNYKYQDGTNSWCYDNYDFNCDFYGRLYTWSAAKDACPENWHLPTIEEFEQLLRFIDPDNSTAVKTLRTSSGWATDDGTNSVGFSALPAGYLSPGSSQMTGASYYTDFWSISEKNEYDAYLLAIGAGPDNSSPLIAQSKSHGFSVRCVQGKPQQPKATDFLNPNAEYGETTDNRDNEVYKTVNIGWQTWMAQNLNYNSEESTCYDNKDYNCDTYGRLYTWDDAQTVCPEGWHLPKWEEYDMLLEAVGGISVGEPKLKASSGWATDYNGTNESGFSLLPAGIKQGSPKKFDWLIHGAFLQTSSKDFTYGPCDVSLIQNGKITIGGCSNDYSTMRSVRCVMDYKAWDFLNPDKEYGEFTDSRDNQVYKTIKIGEQTWMAQNLNYESAESACYDDKPENCKTFGRLYTWDDAQTVCPEEDGWTLPNTSDYGVLIKTVSDGDESDAGAKLKTTKAWVKGNNGTDDYGFSMLPSGYRVISGTSDKMFSDTEFQTSTKDNINGPCAAAFYDGNFESGLCRKNDNYMRAVRCIKKTDSP